MEREVDYAANWWSTQIDSEGLSPYQISGFTQSLKKSLQNKYSDHWYINCPTRGQAYRAIESDASKGASSIDTCLVQSAKAVGISDIAKRLPLYAIKMWVDPGEVEVSSNNASYTLYRSSLQTLPSDSPIRGTQDAYPYYEFSDHSTYQEASFQQPLSSSPPYDSYSSESFADDYQSFCATDARVTNDYPNTFYQPYFHREASRV